MYLISNTEYHVHKNDSRHSQYSPTECVVVTRIISVPARSCGSRGNNVKIIGGNGPNCRAIVRERLIIGRKWIYRSQKYSSSSSPPNIVYTRRGRTGQRMKNDVRYSAPGKSAKRKRPSNARRFCSYRLFATSLPS